MSETDYMFPTSQKEVKALGWDYIDVILFTGDAFVDHPSFGTACIARWLQHFGYRVAVVPQPNWRDDLRDFKKLGTPRLYFGVNAGAMDSMVNHYTAGKRLRHDDAYTPEGKAGQISILTFRSSSGELRLRSEGSRTMIIGRMNLSHQS